MASFYEKIPEAIRNLSHNEAVERYTAGAGVPAESVAGLSRQQLNSLPIPGTWSIQQIVIHLLDSDLAATFRMKKAIAENRPRLEAYDESAFAKNLFYQELSAADACELFRRNRLFTADILRRLPADAFGRVALHPEVGEISVGQFVRIYVHHLNHHLEFIKKKRSMLEGKQAV